MAIIFDETGNAVQEPLEYTAEASSTEHTTTEGPTVTLPDKDDVTALTQLSGHLGTLTDRRGVKTLLSKLSIYQYHQNLATKNWSLVQSCVDYVNGIRSSGNLVGDKKRSVRHIAESFYGALSPALLVTQYQVSMGIAPDSNMTQAEMIERLVQHYISITVPVTVDTMEPTGV